jgi:hypothetical protein
MYTLRSIIFILASLFFGCAFIFILVAMPMLFGKGTAAAFFFLMLMSACGYLFASFARMADKSMVY